MKVQLFYVGSSETNDADKTCAAEAEIAAEESGNRKRSAMKTVFYDQDEAGEVRSYSFRAYEDAEGCLWVETDMDVAEITVRSGKNFEKIYLNGKAVD